MADAHLDSRSELSADAVRAAQRILIIGSPGAGKSTLANRLSEIVRLPVIHLDNQYWQAGWRRPPTAAWAEKLAELLARDRWIMDGNYMDSMALRLERADLVLDLDFPPLLCLARVSWRGVRRLLGDRSSLPREIWSDRPRLDVDPAFVRLILGFRSTQRPRMTDLLSRFRGDRRVFQSPRELEAFLAQLGSESNPSHRGTPCRSES